VVAEVAPTSTRILDVPELASGAFVDTFIGQAVDFSSQLDDAALADERDKCLPWQLSERRDDCQHTCGRLR
jgi:hypothetical protein